MNELHLFAGAGGGILGGMLLGHTCVCAVEIEPYCRKVLLQRQRDGILPKFPIWDDVKTFNGKPWRGKVDVVCGGFPCQDISVAGSGKGLSGERSGLWFEMGRIISEIRPNFAFVENSPNLVLRGLNRVLGDFTEMGYDATWDVFSAAEVGAPHLRERIFILASNTDSERCELRSCNRKGRQVQNQSEWNASEDQSKRYRREHRIGKMGEAHADAYGDRLETNSNEGAIRESSRNRGLPRRFSEIHCPRIWDETRPIGCRPMGMDDGLAEDVGAIKAAGNGQVPAVVKLAWETLMT